MSAISESTPVASFRSMSRSRRTSLLAGLFFAATFVTSIAALLLYEPVLNHTDFILGSGDVTKVTMGAVLELLLIIANIGTALVLYPVLRRQSEVAALGWVAARIMESAFIAVGILALLAIVTLRQESGAEPATLVAIGESLVAIHDWTFWVGPGFVVGIGNGLLLGYLMFKSGLVPRGMAMLGLIGGPMLCLAGFAVVLGVIDHDSVIKSVATIPEILWEASLTFYLIFKGFRDSPILREVDAEG